MIEKYILVSFIILIILIYLLNIINYNKKKEFFDNNNNNNKNNKNDNLLKNANWTILILNDFKSELLNKNLKENYNTFMKEMKFFVDNYNTVNNTKWWIFNIFQTKIEYLKNLSESEPWINDITINFNNIFDFYLYNKKPDYVINKPKIINNKLILPPVFKNAPLPPFSNFKESSVNKQIIPTKNTNTKTTTPIIKTISTIKPANTLSNLNTKTNLTENKQIITNNISINKTLNRPIITESPKDKQIITYRPRQINNIPVNRPLNTPIITESPKDKKIIKSIDMPYSKDKNIIMTTPSPLKKFNTNQPIVNTPPPTQSIRNKPIFTTTSSAQSIRNKNIIMTTPSPLKKFNKNQPIINTPSQIQPIRNKPTFTTTSSAQPIRNKPTFTTTSSAQPIRNKSTFTTTPSKSTINKKQNITTPPPFDIVDNTYSLFDFIKNKIIYILNSFLENNKVITEGFKINQINNSLPKNKNIPKDKKIIINGDKNSSITIPSSLDGKYGNLNIHVNYNSENSVNNLNNNKTNCGANNTSPNNKLSNNNVNNNNNNNSIPEYTIDNSSRIYTNKDWIYPEKCLNNSGCGNKYYNSTNYKNGYYNANDNNNFIQSLNNAPEDPITSIGNYNPINNYISPNSFYR